MDERLSAALNAKSFGDLRRIMADLPVIDTLGFSIRSESAIQNVVWRAVSSRVWRAHCRVTAFL
jgi:hypothetical protein